MSYGFNKQDPILYPRVQGSDWNALVDYVTGSLSGSGGGSGNLSSTGSYVVANLTGSNAISGSVVRASTIITPVATIGDLTFTNITGSNIYGAGASIITINSTDITATGTLSGSNLQVSDIVSPYITGSVQVSTPLVLASNITGSGTISGSSIKGSTIVAPYISGSEITGSNVYGVSITSPSFTGSRAGITNIQATNITGSNVVSGSNLYGALALITTINSTTENTTNINASNITGSGNISGSSIRGTNIIAAVSFSSPSFTGSSFTGSSVYVSGQITAGNVQINGGINATGSISGSSVIGNSITGGSLSVTGSVLGDIISGSTYQNLPTSTSGGSGSFSSITVTGSESVTGDLSVGGNLTSQTLTYTNLITTNIVAVNVTGSSQVSGSTIYGQNAKIQAIYGQNVSGSILSGSTSVSSPIVNGASINAGTITATGTISGSTIQGAFSPASIVATTVTGSNIVSGSNVYGATAKITNINATNVTGSGILSGSTIYGQNATITNIYAGTVSGSNGLFGTVTYTNIAATNISGSQESLSGNLYVNGIISGSVVQGGSVSLPPGTYYAASGFASGSSGMNISSGLNTTIQSISIVPSGSTPIEYSVALSGSDGFYIYHTAGGIMSFWWGVSVGQFKNEQYGDYVFSVTGSTCYATSNRLTLPSISGTDHADIIQRAVNAVSGSGLWVFKQGVYNISGSDIVLPSNSRSYIFVGEGPWKNEYALTTTGGSVLNFTDGKCFKDAHTVGTWAQVVFRDLGFRFAGTYTGSCLMLNYSIYQIYNCKFGVECTLPDWDGSGGIPGGYSVIACTGSGPPAGTYRMQNVMFYDARQGGNRSTLISQHGESTIFDGISVVENWDSSMHGSGSLFILGGVSQISFNDLTIYRTSGWKVAGTVRNQFHYVGSGTKNWVFRNVQLLTGSEIGTAHISVGSGGTVYLNVMNPFYAEGGYNPQPITKAGSGTLYVTGIGRGVLNSGYTSGSSGVSVAHNLIYPPTNINITASGSNVMLYSTALSGSTGFYVYHTGSGVNYFYWRAAC
jgi:uncharacterized protein YjbI with pentapeptide repeats